MIAQFGINAAGITESQRIARSILLSIVVTVVVWLVFHFVWVAMRSVGRGMRTNFIRVFLGSSVVAIILGLVAASLHPNVLVGVAVGIATLIVVALYWFLLDGFGLR